MTSIDTGNGVQPEHETSAARPAPLVIDGVSYFSAAVVARSAGVTRQTLWRWRQDGKVPAGLKYRDKQVVFTNAEMELVLEYAHRLEPLEAAVTTEAREQLRLFGAKGGKRP